MPAAAQLRGHERHLSSGRSGTSFAMVHLESPFVGCKHRRHCDEKGSAVSGIRKRSGAWPTGVGLMFAGALLAAMAALAAVDRADASIKVAGDGRGAVLRVDRAGFAEVDW